MTLRLEQLRDRTPVRMSISVDPELSSALADYAEIYHRTYGPKEKPETLVPAMLESFLKQDAGFKRARKALTKNPKQGDRDYASNRKLHA